MNLWQRIARFVPAELLALLLIAVPLALVALERIDHINSGHVITGTNDTDPWLRLTLARDWLEGGDWFDHEMKRSNAPEGGIASPWTRPLDLALAGLVKLQPDDADLTTKLLRAAAALPLIWMIVLMLGLFSGARQLHASPLTYLMLAAIVGATPVLWSYFGKGNADHHALLAALWAWVLAYAIRPDPRPRDCWAQGLLLALMLWISPEALILIMLVFGWQLVRWLADGQRLMPLAHLTSATAYGALLFIVIERAPGTWLHPIYDSLSIVHGIVLGFCALVVRAFALLPDRFMEQRRYRFLGAMIGGTLLLLAVALLYPDFFRGPMADVAPFILNEFLPRIREAKPLFAKPFLFATALVVLPLAAIGLYGWMLRVSDPLMPRPIAAQLLLFQLATLAFALTQMRWYYYVFPVTALMLAPVIGALVDDDARWPARLLAKRPAWAQSALRLAAIGAAIGLPLLLISLSPPLQTAKGKQISACEMSARTAIRSGAITRALGREPKTVYAPTNLGTEILFFTPHRIIASNYHREGESIRYVWDALKIADAAELRAYLAKRKVDAVLVCPDGRASKRSVLMRWQQGKKRPDWAKRIPLNGTRGPSEPLLLRIVKERP